MELQEIVNRVSPQQYDVREMEYVVEKYIQEKKGVTITVNCARGLDVRNTLHLMLYSRQMDKLNEAFDVAAKYFINKNK